MRALFTNGRGKVIVRRRPRPKLRSGFILSRTKFACISSGTEGRMVRRRVHLPEDSREASRWVQFGYSDSGVVEKVSGEIEGVKPDDRVGCYGGPWVRNQDFNAVPKHLFCKVPRGVSLKEASFVGIGAIGLNAFRRAEVGLGETLLIQGLGLMGQLIIQYARIAGVETIGVDVDDWKLVHATKLGHRGPLFNAQKHKAVLRKALEISGGFGVDSVIIATGTQGPEIMELSVSCCRDKGKIVHLGGGGPTPSRQRVKEIDSLMVRAAGAGRYDPFYEEEGQDYPIGYARWTENRNMCCFLSLIAQDKVNVSGLITHIFPMEKTEEAINLIADPNEHTLAVLLKF